MTPTPGPVLTVVMPVRDGEHLVGDAVRSIVAQLGDGDRLVVVDDASTDATVRVAREAGAEVLELPESGGPYRARNLGAERAVSGALVFTDVRCRARDGWLDSHRRLASGGADLWYVNVEVVDTGTTAARVAAAWDFFDARQFLRSSMGVFFPTCDLGVTVEAFRDHGGFDEVRGTGDVAFCLDVLRGGGRHDVDLTRRMGWLPRTDADDLVGQFRRYGVSSAMVAACAPSPRREVAVRAVRAVPLLAYNVARVVRRYPTDPAAALLAARVQLANEQGFVSAYRALRRGETVAH